METVFLKVADMAYGAGWLILAVVFFRFLLKKAPKWMSCLLWALVAFKLFCPFTIESAFSLVPEGEPLPSQVMTEDRFQAPVGIKNMDTPVNAHSQESSHEEVTIPEEQEPDVLQILGIVWALGFTVFVLYGLIGYCRLARLTLARVNPEKGVFLCDNIDTPFILGILRPRICLPSAMKPEQAAYVIAHERMHLKRRDHLWKPLGFLLLAVYWFYPLVWLSYILFCRDMEAACDERVIREMGQESKKPYAQALLSCSVRQSPVTPCPLAFGEVGVKERVKNILHYKKPAFWVMAAAMVCFVIAAVCFLTSPKKEEAEAEQNLVEEVTAKESGVVVAGDAAKQAEVTRKAQDTEEAESTEAQEELAQFLWDWQAAFCARDGEAIASIVTKELADRLLAGTEGSYSFGVSSPWPWDAESDAMLYEYDGERAVIYYYAMTSDPHVTCWREEVAYVRENDRYVITEETLTCFEEISTGEEFKEAYPLMIEGTRMDYSRNGLGETLNESALLSSSMAYRDLFEPESAAAFLLNLSDDPSKVQIVREAGQEEAVGLHITFLQEQMTFKVSMIQPYGASGIWVPVDHRVDVIARMKHVDKEKWLELEFEPEEKADLSGILCIGEIPEKDIRVYGYNDEDVMGRGVAVAFGSEEFYYYDWYYVSPRMLLPDVCWEEGKECLQIACLVHAGTGMSAEELHILQRGKGMQETNFGLDDYRLLLEERIGWDFEKKTKTLVLTDKKTGERLAEVTVPSDVGYRVTALELGMISGFTLGDEVIFTVFPGYYVDEIYGAAEYEGMPGLAFELEMTPGEDGRFAYTLGDVTVREGDVTF